MNTLTYRTLPDGSITKSVNRYCREWNRIAMPVAKALECNIIGMDPGILLSPKEGGPPLNMSVPMANRIRKLIS